MKKIFTLKHISAAAIPAIAASVFIINFLTPHIADDYLNLAHKIWGTNQVITDFNDFIHSMRNFYFYWGGRMEGCMFSTLLAYVPPAAVDILNTVCYMAATLLIYLICKGGQKNSLPLYLGIHFLLWACVPDYGQVMFWICGSANYLWTSVIVLACIYLYRCYALSKGTLFSSPVFGIPTFALGFLAGFAMENMSAGMLVICTLYFVYFYKYHGKIQLPMISAYLGSLAGFAFLVFAPGNQARAHAEIELPLVFKFFVVSYYWVTFVGALSILWIVLNKLAMHILQGTYKETACESLIYVCGAVSAAYCMLAAPTSPERTWYIVCVYAVIAAGLFYSALELHQPALIRRMIQIVTAGAMVMLFVSMADTMINSYEISVQTREREQYILEQKALGNLDIHTPVISHQYPFRARHDALAGLSDITTDPEFWINRAVADYYGVDSITGTEP